MRISTDERDSGHRAFLSWGNARFRFRVLLDGEDLKGCITADEELGEALVVERDAGGGLIRDGDRLKTAWHRGRVEIVLPGRDAA